MVSKDFQLWLHEPGSFVDGVPPASGGIPLFMNHSQRKSGVFLPEVPNIGWLLDKSHSHVSVVGSPGGIWQASTRAVLERQLRVRIKGTEVDHYRNWLLESVGDGEDYFYIVMRKWSDDDEKHVPYLYLKCRLKSVDSAEWNGWVTDTQVCNMTINFVLETPLWYHIPQTIPLSSFQNGVSSIMLDNMNSTEPIWPEFIVTGRRDWCSVRLSANETWQQIGTQDMRIISDPQRRANLLMSGVHAPNLKAYWSKPMPVKQPIVLVNVLNPGDDFKVTIKYQPMTWKAW